LVLSGDAASGEVVLRQIDVNLPGVMPLVLERTHVSSYHHGRLFGVSWASTLDQRLEVDGRGVLFASVDGMVLAYPPPVTPDAAVFPHEGPRWPLTRTDDGYTIDVPQEGRTLRFQASFEGDGTEQRLAAVRDRNGNLIDLHYEDGTLIEVRHSGGYRIAVDSDEGHVTALRLLTEAANGRSGGQVLVRYSYDQAGHLAEVINASGRPFRFDYDPEGRLTRWTDRNGYWYRYVYDDQGRCVRGIGSGGFLTASLAYETGATVVTDSLGRPTTYQFNELGQVVAETGPDGGTAKSEWDHDDRLLRRTDPLGRATGYEYDDLGGLTAVVRPDGSRVTFQRDPSGRPTEIVEPDGAVWPAAYDARGNPIRVTDPAGETMAYSYDPRGGLAAITDPIGHTVRIENNAAGLPVSVTDALGNTTRYHRDAAGRVSAIVDPVNGVPGPPLPPPLPSAGDHGSPAPGASG
jgi:YD repeat-containing protein